MKAPILGLFVFRPFAQTSIVLPYSKIELLRKGGRSTFSAVSLTSMIIDNRQPLGGLKHRAIYNIQQA
jgi:hypothetical protein|nr:MAG TPA: hypothetical protein [Caudoviricetes sp.]